jgi:hypothetical protein
MPTVRVRPLASPTARALGTYPISSMTFRTRCAVLASTSGFPFSTRDTVALDTWARWATSAIVTRMPNFLSAASETGFGTGSDEV